MKYLFAIVESEGKEILLVLVDFEFLSVFQGWRYKSYLKKMHGGDVIGVGYKEDDGTGEYTFDSETELSLTKEELDILPWKEDELTTLN